MLETYQARMAAAASTVALLIMVLYYALMSNVITTIFVGLMSILITILTVYDIHCVVAGQCNTWSWIKSVLVLISGIAIIYAYAKAIRRDEEPREDRSNLPPVVVVDEGRMRTE
jgi:predicted anti-sigma-YlaC factor YlaD